MPVQDFSRDAGSLHSELPFAHPVKNGEYLRRAFVNRGALESLPRHHAADIVVENVQIVEMVFRKPALFRQRNGDRSGHVIVTFLRFPRGIHVEQAIASPS